MKGSDTRMGVVLRADQTRLEVDVDQLCRNAMANSGAMVPEGNNRLVAKSGVPRVHANRQWQTIRTLRVTPKPQRGNHRVRDFDRKSVPHDARSPSRRPNGKAVSVLDDVVHAQAIRGSIRNHRRDYGFNSSPRDRVN